MDGAPEVLLHALDPDEDFVHVPLVPWPRPAAAQAVGETRTEFLAPALHRLVGDDNGALSQEQLNIPQAEAEQMVQPDSVADGLDGEPVAPSCRQSRQPPRIRPGLVTVTMPRRWLAALQSNQMPCGRHGRA